MLFVPLLTVHCPLGFLGADQIATLAKFGRTCYGVLNLRLNTSFPCAELWLTSRKHLTAFHVLW